MSSFFFEEYVRHQAAGLEALRRGDGEEARYHLLMGARRLLELAKAGEEALKPARHEKAKRLMDLVEQIRAGKVPPLRGREGERRRIADGEGTGGRAERWLLLAKPGVRFGDIAGLEEVKRTIRLTVIEPMRHPDTARKFRRRPGGGVLLYGPPGTGKTMIAKAIATELEAAFFSVRCSDIMSKWVGQAEKNVSELFAEARSQTPSVVFLDEAEAIVARRGGDSTVMARLIPEFLSQVDGLETGEASLLLLGATNRPWDMDEAALRPGRFERLIYVGLPDEAARRKILAMQLEGVPLAPDVDLDALTARTDRLSGADLKGLANRILEGPFSREIETGEAARVECRDIDAALAAVRPSVTPSALKRYERFRAAR